MNQSAEQSVWVSEAKRMQAFAFANLVVIFFLLHKKKDFLPLLHWRWAVRWLFKRSIISTVFTSSTPPPLLPSLLSSLLPPFSPFSPFLFFLFQLLTSTLLLKLAKRVNTTMLVSSVGCWISSRLSLEKTSKRERTERGVGERCRDGGTCFAKYDS